MKIGDAWLLPRPRYPARGWIACAPVPFQRVTARSSTTALAFSVCRIVSMLALCSGRFQAYSPATLAITTYMCISQEVTHNLVCVTVNMGTKGTGEISGTG